jgi:glucose-6-phosphate 1-dehydrogenase
MLGDSTRFTRQDNIEETWRICGPLLEKPPRILPYKRGTWGPKAADRLVKDYGGWRDPWTGS